MSGYVRFFFLFILGTAIPLSGCILDPQPFDEKRWMLEVAEQDVAQLYAPHEKDGVFFNPWMTSDDRFLDFLRWRLSWVPDYGEAESYLPEVVPHLAQRIEALPPEDDFLVWLGHGSFLLRIQSTYFLTDPILTHRALLPARVTPAAMSLEELSRLEGALEVILSHNHYDHLDLPTIRSLPVNARIHAPLGLGEYLAANHSGEVLVYDWWQSEEHKGWRLTSLPAQHWSRRIWQATNTTLWASYMIETESLTIYFGGDSGYFVGYREFGRLFPNIDYALLPTTAYHPRWFMHYPHLNVQEALKAFDDLGAHYFVPTQWGTFRLGDNPPGLPMIELGDEIEKQNRQPDRFLRLAIGEIVLL